MFSLGPQEIIFILIIALVIFGPKKLPDMVKAFVKVYSKIKKEVNEVTQQVHFESIIESDEELKNLRDKAKNGR